MAKREGIDVGADGIARCRWCAADPLYRQYHDTEWGRPVREEIQRAEIQGA